MIFGRMYALRTTTARTQLRLAVTVSGLFGLLAVYGPLHIPCLFSTVTGVQCPACGLTRSVVAAARGDLAMSLAYHPAGIGLVGVAFAALVSPKYTLKAYDGASKRWGALSLITRTGIGAGILFIVWSWNLTRAIPR